VPGSRLAAALLAVAVLLANPGHAGAVEGTEPVARALRAAPLYVDPALAGSVRPAERATLLRGIRAAPRPVFVAVVPLVPGDAYGGDARSFLAALHQRLDRAGIYVTVSDRILTARDFGSDDNLADLAAAVANLEGSYREPATATLARFLDALRDPNLRARYDREQGRTFGPTGDTDRGGGGGGKWIAPVVALAVLLAAGLAVARRRRRARPARREAAALPGSVFARAQEAADDEAREAADRETLALAEALGRAPVPERAEAQEAYGRALDAAAAARRILDDARGTSDLVGALVLAQDGRLDLAEAQAREAGGPVPARQRRCAFDPRHGPAAGEARWGKLGLPACERCIEALSAGVAPEALLDQGRPYLERDTVWSRTGYGALDDDLLPRVSRGER
jgi:hypothetical protein